MEYLITNDTKIKKKTYTEAQKQAIYRYRLKNKEKINDQAKKDYQKTKLKKEEKKNKI